jgi:Ca2+-binding RTX toxin-like protein
VTLDLGAGTAGPGHELRSIENASGGNGPDVLRGSAGGETLTGGPGDDTIDGLAGDDSLHGSDDDDRIDGGPGDDHVAGWDGRDDLTGGPGDDFLDPWRFDFRDDHERVSCGSGSDRLFLPEVFREIPGRFRRVPADCELLQAEYSGLGLFRPEPRIERGTASWSLRCAQAVWKGRCPVTFELRGGGRSLGSGTLNLRKGSRGRLVAPLNEAGRRRARKGGPLEVGIRMKSNFGSYAFGRVHRFEVTLPASR